MKTLSYLEWLKTLSVERLQQFDVAKANAEAFIRDIQDYGLPALDVNILPFSQVELCNAYAFIFKPQFT